MSTTPKHTPGPWTVFTATNDTVYVETRDKSLARVHMLSGMPPVIHPVALANAHLMAAAPELLDAAERLLEHFSSGLPRHMIEELAEAVAKARGESSV